MTGRPIKSFIQIVVASLLLVFGGTTLLAHSGGTNADGCHTNRKTGEYHCHTPKTPPPGRQTYCHVLHGERRCGYARSTCDDLVDQFGGTCVAQ